MSEPTKRPPMKPVAKVAMFIGVKLVLLSGLTLAVLRWKGLV